MTPFDLAVELHKSGQAEKALVVERMIVGLKIAAKNLYGNGLESLQDIHPNFAREIADLCADAESGEPNQRLDEALKNIKRPY